MKDADGVRNVGRILEAFSKEKILVVVSAMGKTTNHLEELVHALQAKGDKGGKHEKKAEKILNEIKKYHAGIIDGLKADSKFPFFNDIDNLFLELECLMETLKKNDDYDFVYDQVVSFGELISTRIISNYLLSVGMKNQWVDARNFIITDSRHRDARIQWDETCNLIGNRLKPLASRHLLISQGFIGRGPKNETTTLGREGSDYSAAIFAYALKADEVVIWKDVAGVMNADPKKFDFAKLLPKLSYNDTIELAYFGASVIHPKTIQPLKAGSIPLRVKSFLDINKGGTTVSTFKGSLDTPCYILKENQVLLDISTKDFTFVAEENLGAIFSIIGKYKLRSNMMQNSAISFSFAADYRKEELQACIHELKKNGFEVKAKEDLSLLTIYNAKSAEWAGMLKGKKVLMEQKIGDTLHFLYA